MSKKMKKLMAVLLCFAMLFSVTTVAQAKEDTADVKQVSIGFIGWGYTDTLGAAYKEYFDYIAEEFGMNVTLVAGTTQEEHISLAEDLIEAGVDGILAYQVTSPMMKLCDEAGVYLMQFGSPITDEDIQANLDGSDYWLGTSSVDDYKSGQNMVEALYEDGCRNMVVLGVAAGNPCHDLRWNGIMDKAAEYDDMTVIGEYRGGTAAAQEYSDQVQNFVAMYPEMDSIAMTGASSGNLDAVLSALDTVGMTGTVKLATLDVQEGTDTYLEEGSLLFIGGGQHPEVVFLAILMADIIRGSLDMGGEEVSLVGQFINIVGTDGYEEFKKYIMDDFPYYIEELKAVSTSFNPDTSYQELYDLWNSYSLDDVETRHAK